MTKTIVIDCDNSHPLFRELFAKHLSYDPEFKVSLIADGDIVRKNDGLLALIPDDRPSYAEWDAIVEYIEDNL